MAIVIARGLSSHVEKRLSFIMRAFDILEKFGRRTLSSSSLLMKQESGSA
jgi:hypothetical protein